jgi:hypothetical protein
VPLRFCFREDSDKPRYHFFAIPSETWMGSDCLLSILPEKSKFNLWHLVSFLWFRCLSESATGSAPSFLGTSTTCAHHVQKYFDESACNRDAQTFSSGCLRPAQIAWQHFAMDTMPDLLRAVWLCWSLHSCKFAANRCGWFIWGAWLRRQSTR